MSGGRWERQPNGDYQHFTDEELEERAKNNTVLAAAICLIAGPAIMLYQIHDINVIFYFGCVLALIGLLGSIILQEEGVPIFDTHSLH